MSLSFTCPSCRANMEVPDELAGQSGQCPRCQHVFTIPLPKAPPQPTMPVGRALPGAPTRIPPTDPWATDLPRPDDPPRSRLGESNRPRRVRALPPQPSGPMWPWTVGILGALVVCGLLFASFLVLVTYRKPMTVDNRALIKGQVPPAAFNNQVITIGRFDGHRASFDNGVFQIRSDLNQTDPLDPNNFNCRRKRYDIELRAFQTYIVEMESQQFDPRLRVEVFNNFVDQQGFRFNQNVAIFVRPNQNQVYTIYASSVEPRNGSFTLTVREDHRPRPPFNP